MLTKLLAMTKAELKSKIQSIDEAAVKSRAMRRQLAGMKKKEGGFTLLELLVVVAILAAIAGTATIMLQDTDRKGAAAAHVAMMDELSKGIQTFRVLNQGNYPDIYDSLLSDATGTLGAGAISRVVSGDLAGNLSLYTVTTPQVQALANVGITRVRVLDESLAGCANVAAGAANSILDTITSKENDVTPQNIFRPATANGCGAATHAAIGTFDANGALTGVAGQLVRWNSAQNGRVNANPNDVVLAFGIGPDSTLFDPAIIGALSNVPVYRHVTNSEYNRFIALYKVEGSGVRGQAVFQAIIDGAGDTKDEELGEVDNVRRT